MFAYAAGLEVLFIDAMHGFASGKGYDGGVILETFDGGVNWPKSNSGLRAIMYGNYSCATTTPIFLFYRIGFTGPVTKIFDSGATWVMKTFQTTMQGVGFVSDTKRLMGGYNSGFHETNDGGDTSDAPWFGMDSNRFFF